MTRVKEMLHPALKPMAPKLMNGLEPQLEKMLVNPEKSLKDLISTIAVMISKNKKFNISDLVAGTFIGLHLAKISDNGESTKRVIEAINKFSGQAEKMVKIFEDLEKVMQEIK